MNINPIIKFCCDLIGQEQTSVEEKKTYNAVKYVMKLASGDSIRVEVLDWQPNRINSIEFCWGDDRRLPRNEIDRLCDLFKSIFDMKLTCNLSGRTRFVPFVPIVIKL